MTITVEEVTAQRPALQEKIAGGESVTITRQGIPVARLVPASEPETLTPAEAVEGILELRQTIAHGPPFLQELLAEGRQHSYEANHGK